VRVKTDPGDIGTLVAIASLYSRSPQGQVWHNLTFFSKYSLEWANAALATSALSKIAEEETLSCKAFVSWFIGVLYFDP
jgi:hypothetical protein